MIASMVMTDCPNLAVPAQVMRHIVRVESGANPFAIGVVGGRLVRQPRTLQEAVATAHMLEARGYNYSVGAAQVNRANFRRYGLDSYQKAFDPCANLGAGASILANCRASARGDWGKAFSCYYSGNFVTGFRTGYVQRVYDSIRRDELVAQATPWPRLPERVASPDLAGPVAGGVPSTGAPAAGGAAPATAAPPIPAAPASGTEVFVPQVRYPGGKPTSAAPAAAPVVPERAGGDGAFVF